MVDRHWKEVDWIIELEARLDNAGEGGDFLGVADVVQERDGNHPLQYCLQCFRSQAMVQS